MKSNNLPADFEKKLIETRNNATNWSEKEKDEFVETVRRIVEEIREDNAKIVKTDKKPNAQILPEMSSPAAERQRAV